MKKEEAPKEAEVVEEVKETPKAVAPSATEHQTT